MSKHVWAAVFMVVVLALVVTWQVSWYRECRTQFSVWFCLSWVLR